MSPNPLTFYVSVVMLWKFVFLARQDISTAVFVRIFRATWFTGNTVIKDEKTVVKLPGGSGQLLSDTLEFIFAAFPPVTILHPGHGESLLLRDTLPQIHYPLYRKRKYDSVQAQCSSSDRAFAGFLALPGDTGYRS
jgi:glyoxylase-like metal-dependent hydrolase (beta-lactamase superfamily II)